MEVYIGMDVSLQETQVCVVDGDGKMLHEGRAGSDPKLLREHIEGHAKSWQIKRIGLETGPLSGHIHQGLQAAGLPVICMDARHAHGVLKAQREKTDRNDARGLAQLVRTGWYKEVYVKSPAGQSLRTLLAARKQLVRLRVDMENHVRGTLKAYGIKLGSVTRTGFRQKVEDAVTGQDTLVRQSMAALMEARQALLCREKDLEKACKAIAKGDAVCKRFMGIPGVGLVTALSYKAEIDDPSRFDKSRDIGVHLGLTPRRYASGEIDRTGGISKCGNRALRSLLFEAAVVMLTRSRKWSRLKHWGIQVAKRSSFRTAAAAVARKLSIIMHRMWIDETEFAYGAMQAS
jgi:transposase